jgi:hypothetical protein
VVRKEPAVEREKRLLPYIPPLWGKYYHYYYCMICGRKNVFFCQAGAKDITQFKYSKLSTFLKKVS